MILLIAIILINSKKWKRRQKNSWNVFVNWIKYLDNLETHLAVITMINKQKDDLRTFLNFLNHKFDIICISESRISTKHPQTTNIDLPDLNIE